MTRTERAARRERILEDLKLHPDRSYAEIAAEYGMSFSGIRSIAIASGLERGARFPPGWAAKYTAKKKAELAALIEAAKKQI